jgi:hypothetical protein
MHSGGVRAWAAIFVLALAWALVACSGLCQRRHTTGDLVPRTSATITG